MAGYTSFVDSFLGVDGPGSCLPGPYLPLGQVRLGPDVIPPYHPTGYRSDHPIARFSHTHVSGTGGAGKYGNVGITPFVASRDDPNRLRVEAYAKSEETARPGFYGVMLEPAGIRAELTVTQRTGLHRYTFPTAEDANVLIDIGAVIECAVESGSAFEMTGVSIGGYAEVASPTELVGRADLRGGWGHDFPYSVYFCLRLGRPARRWILGRADAPSDDRLCHGPDCRAVAVLSGERLVELQVGISYVSVGNARHHLDGEVGNRGFDEVRAEADAVWERSLSRIRVEGGADDLSTVFYSLFARLLCMPSDLGQHENPLWRSDVRQFTDFYCLWDSVRITNSLITLFDPELEADFLRCLLDVADHIGWLPDVWTAGHSAFIQGGSSADVLLCEAALKGLPGIDYEKALRQTRKNNEVESPDPRLYGRYLRDYRDLGYLSTNVEKNCVSRHLEYAYQDWCIAALAEHLGRHDVAETYRRSAAKVWNLWNEDLRCFAPRRPDGAWAEPFDPLRCRPDSWNDPYFYEGTSIQWSFNVQHDFAGLVRRHGGPGSFVGHLDRFFEDGHYHSKETMLHVPYLYHYAGRPDRSAERVRACMARYFRSARDGLSDNEDMGCQSAWFMASCLGLYPLMGQDLYLVSAPAFDRAEVDLGRSGKVLTIEAPGAGAGRCYVGSVTLNGKGLDRCWLRHGEIAEGGVLRFELAAAAGDWGAGEPPPSPMEKRR